MVNGFTLEGMSFPDLARRVQSSGTRDVSQEIRETEDLL